MIQINKVNKSFKGNVAVNNLSLEIHEGEILGLLGANGAGKSTTINLLAGFINPDSGSISILNKSLQENKQEIRKATGYIPENVNLYPYLSGIENLDYFCRLTGLVYSNPKLQQYLIECGLPNEVHNKKVAQYSKGMRQKVGIAIALAKNAKVYLLDEPASGLDPLAANELSEILRKLASKGASILMASHDIFRVREVCHRIGILHKGELVKEVSSDAISANELEKLYLEFMQN